VGQEKQVGRSHAVATDGVRVQQVDVVIVEKDIAQVQIAVAEAGLFEAGDQAADSQREAAVIGGDLSVEQKLIEMGIEGDGRLDGVGDDGVADVAAQDEPDQDGDGVWAVDGGFLEFLEVEEFAQGGIAAEESFESLAAAWVELEEVSFVVESEAPDLAIPAVFDQGCELGKMAQGRFEPLGIRHERVYKIPVVVCLAGARV
jgi:hypothetical protein